jgi:hypothetical protein
MGWWKNLLLTFQTINFLNLLVKIIRKENKSQKYLKFTIRRVSFVTMIDFIKPGQYPATILIPKIR